MLALPGFHDASHILCFAGSVQYLRESSSVELSITVWLVNFGDSGVAYELQRRVADHLPTRHVVLPFNLRLNKKALDREAWDQLCNLFPAIIGVSSLDYFLVFYFGSLPPKPWPSIIAGIQPYFTTALNDDGPTPPINRASKSRLRISAERNPCKTLRSKCQASARMPTRPYPAEFSAQRIRDPTGDIMENSEYELLCPGVMHSSERHPIGGMKLRTTSGVLVEDFRGKRYMATASHGVPDGDRAFHPCAGSREIGHLSMDLNVQLVNETFESTSLEVPPTTLVDFIPANDTQIGSEVYMSNPFTGYCEGTCGPHSRLRIPSDDPSEASIKWIKARWVYMGHAFSGGIMESGFKIAA
ncbi:hypothetical protein BDV33DRAFT_196279 [Aspergillus novoparasiticus]|uniref:Uncharacterized protein n=1 Tax=Aspergillus novoparasiticus TaxID=986946 RepID=A0A5N6E9F9_9EURO|nr:hypothetical protein BDV33DRAFT_196279 [Aspergillus novoparasiticus]